MSTPAIDHQLKVAFSDDYLFRKKNNQLEWLRDDHVGSGIVQAIIDAKIKNKETWSAKKVETNFIAVGNLSWMIGDKLDDKAERILGSQLKQNRLAFDTYYFFHVNNEPYTKKGQHWTILSIYIPKKEQNNKTDVVFNYFDSMGNAIEKNIFSFIEKHVSRVLENNMKAKFKEDVTFNYAKLHDKRNTIQNDGYQCGVWCIWYVHNFILQFPNPFESLNYNQISDNPVEFRKLYFKVEIDLRDQKVEESPDDVEEVTKQVHEQSKQTNPQPADVNPQTADVNPQRADVLRTSLERLRRLTSAEIKKMKKLKELKELKRRKI